MVSGILWSEYYKQAEEVEQLLQELVPEMPYTAHFWWEKHNDLQAELDYLLEQLVITYDQWFFRHSSTEEDQI